MREGGGRGRVGAWVGVGIVVTGALLAWVALALRGGPERAGIAAAPQEAPPEGGARAPAPEAPAEARRTARVAESEQEPPAALAEAEPASAARAWGPELTLVVRDAHSRAELEDVELRALPNSYSRASWAQPGDAAPYTTLGVGLRSPVTLRGGRPAATSDESVRGLGLRRAGVSDVEYLELVGPVRPDRGVVIWARTPQHAWGRLELDLSSAGERELLLTAGAALEVQLANVALEAYAALELPAALYVERPARPWSERGVWKQRLDAQAAADGVLLEGLPPDAYAISVELGDLGSWRERPVLAREELALVAGERRALLLTLAAPPPPRARAPLAGTLSFPRFPGADAVVLRLYDTATYSQGPADAELRLAEMERVGGALPTWRWRVEELRAGRWQVKVWPFLESWMVDLPAEGLEDLELALPELAEVVVETVDRASGERVPLERLGYGFHQSLPDQVNHLRDSAAPDGEPGRFRIWVPPGTLTLATTGMPAGSPYGDRYEEFDVAPGYQELRFALERACAIRFEFRDGEALLPRGDAVYDQVVGGVRAVDHDGRVTHIKTATERIVEFSRPGTYEIGFEGVGAGRYLPVAPQRVDVRPGEVAEVVVELRRE